MEEQSNAPITTEQKLLQLEQKIDYLVKQAKAASMARKITLISGLIFVLLPAIIMMFVLPSILSSITSSYSI